MYEQNILDQQAFAREATIASAVANPYLESGKVLIAETGLFYDVVTTNSTGAIALTNGKFLKHIENLKINGNVLKGSITINASQVPQDANNRFITDTERTNWNNKSNKTVQMIAGNGLTGGGTLEANRTFNVVSANDGIVVNADNIQLNPVNALNSTSTTRPLTAAQGKALEDKKLNLSGGTMSGKLIANEGIDITAEKEISFARNTDYFKLGFKNTADSDTDSYGYITMGDNGNEYFKFRSVSGSTTTDVLSIKTSGITASKFIGSLEGNANTATTLQTARTIGGVSFNGSANINLPGVNTQGNQNTTGNANTATALQTARTIGGVSFNGTANINLPGVNTTGNQNTTGSAATLTTARTLTVGNTGKTFNGSGNVAWSLNEIGSSENKIWTTTIKRGTWSKICELKNLNLGNNLNLSINYTRGNVVCNDLIDISCGHSNNKLIKIFGGSYTKNRYRLTGGPNDFYFEIMDLGGDATGTSQSIRVSANNINTILTPLTSFVLGLESDDSQGVLAINGLTVSETLKSEKEVIAPNFIGKLSGNSDTTTKLQTARTINGTNFDGTGNITTANWGTARNIQIGNTTKSVNGSGNVTWSLAEIGAVNKAGDTMSAALKFTSASTPSVASEPTQLGYGCLSAYGTLRILGNTDNSSTDEPVIIASGKGMTSNAVDGLSVGPNYLRFLGNNVYHAGNKPSKADIGLGSVNNWGASSSIGANSTAEYATTNMVAQVRAEKLNKADRSNWNEKDIWGGVVGQLAWRQHNNGHTIFDASGSKTPTNVTKNNTDPDFPWSAGNPTLMGYNGSNTYGVRVDIARKAEILNTTRTIGGVSFNGSANINLPGVNIAGNQSTSGNAATATKLQNARQINGTNFDGTSAITTTNWGTARTLTIGNTGKSVNGSGNVSWSLSEIGAAASSHTHNELNGNNYVSGGNELPNYFGAGKLRYQMLGAGTTASGGNKGGIPNVSWTDSLWISSYTGGDVKLSNMLCFSKNDARIGFRQQNYDSTTYGAFHEIFHTANKPTATDVGLSNVPNTVHTTAATANTVAVRDSAGDISARLIRTTYGDETTVRGGLMFRVNSSSDNYTRVCNSPSGVRDWLGTGNAANITSGTLAVARGGTGTTSSTGSGSNVLNTSPTFSGTITANAYIVVGGSNRDGGMYGTYDSAKTQSIWSMGTSYKSSATGADFGNLYGLAYKHTNNTTGGTMASGHQIVFCENGIGKSALGVNIWTSGQITAGGNITAYSDARLKKDIQKIENSIEKIKQISGYTFTRIDTNERQAGVIAQEIEKVLPEVINKTKDRNNEELLTVSYGNIVGLLIEGIKEQQIQIEELKSQIKELINIDK